LGELRSLSEVRDTPEGSTLAASRWRRGTAGIVDVYAGTWIATEAPPSVLSTV
jgi:hypothetical protein